MFRERLDIVKKNPIAALYPTAKGWIVILHCVCVSILATMRVNDYAIYLIPFFIIIPVLFAASGIWEKFFKFYKSIFIFIAFIFVVQTLVIRSDAVLFRFGIFNVYAEGLRHAIFLCFIILNVAGILLWLFQTTEIKEMTYVLEKMGINYKASFVFLSTFQMIEVLTKSSKTIMNAQRARGIETEGNLVVRCKAFFPMIVPLVVGSIMNTEERVLTLECRGFDTQCPKTRLLELKKSGNESKAIAFAIIVTAAILMGRIML
jgi:energy-coupling factor transporter transmembrane protein EcfT